MKAVCTIAWLLSTACPLLSQHLLTTAEQRGRQIYELGSTASGRAVTAVMGADNSGIPGTMLPCAHCHGHDGRGKPESGTIPSDITWDALTKPYGVTHASGRTHPPYTERLLKRAVTLGIDPARNPLDSAMPRFQLFNEDFADLAAYIKVLGQNADPGLTSTAIRLGVILPPADRFGDISRVVRDAVLHYFARLNGMGGIFGRQVELSFTELPSKQADAAKTVRDFVTNQQTFALVAGFVNGAESEMAEVLRETGTPSISAFASSPPVGSSVNPYDFYLDGGSKAEVDALAGFAVHELPDKRVRVAIAADELSRESAHMLREQLMKAGFENIVERTTSADVIFWLRPESATLSGSLSPNVRIYVAAAHGVPSTFQDPRAWQSKGVAAAEVITEALKRSGRSVSRDALVEALDGIYRFDTSNGPVTFGPTRRIGITGADVLMLDPKTHRLENYNSVFSRSR